jgi:hypothetical protein
MGYDNFKKLRQVTKTFGLDARSLELFEQVPLVEPSPWLTTTLAKSQLFPLTNEKVKSERIVSPILGEVGEAFLDRATLFSGEELAVDASRDLAGECDFFFALSPYKPYLESPIISLVEAKDEDMEYGIAQCAAQLYGAKLFNDNNGKDIPVLYGCATDRVEWRFMRFQAGVFYLDVKVYTQLREILGVWHLVLKSYL